jgi:hypothetical protein
MSHVNRAHAASPDQPVDFIGADTFPVQARAGVGACLAKAYGGKHFFLGARSEQRVYLRLEQGIFPAPYFNPRLPFARWERQHFIENCFDQRQHRRPLTHGMVNLPIEVKFHW